MKNFVFYILTVLISIIIFLFFDFLLSSTVLKYSHCYNYEEYYYELKKNCSGKNRFKKSFPLVDIYTDELGLRVGKKNSKKDQKKENIFVFGDSFTYGVGLKYDETYVGLIENSMQNYNVYNFAVSSYSPSVYLFKLKKALNNNLIPKKILLFLDLTDVLDEGTRWEYNELDSTVKLSNNFLFLNNQKVLKNFKKKYFKISTNVFSFINYNLRFARERIKFRYSGKYKIKTSIQGNFTYTETKELDQRFWKSDTFEKGLQNIRSRLNEITLIAQEYNSEFFLIIYPWAETLAFGQQKFNWSNFAKSICDRKSCTLINTIPGFENYKDNNGTWASDLYFINDEHFNTKGNNLMYKLVIDYINF